MPEGCDEDQKYGDNFFLRRRIKLDDAKELRKLCLALSINLNSGFDTFESMSIFDLLDVCEDYKELTKDINRKAGKYR